jgi:hypothetical protein
MWAMMNILQLISYLNLLAVLIPENLGQFLEYMAFAHGFNNMFPNLFAKFLKEGDINSEPLNQTFFLRGFHSRIMVLLCGGDIEFIFFFLTLIPVIHILAPKHKYNFWNF